MWPQAVQRSVPGVLKWIDDIERCGDGPMVCTCVARGVPGTEMCSAHRRQFSYASEAIEAAIEVLEPIAYPRRFKKRRWWRRVR